MKNISNCIDPEGVKPFLKWAGGKRALLPVLLPIFPNFQGRYIEPFLGAGAVMFSMKPGVPKIANDFNSDLIEVYLVIRDHVQELVETLKNYEHSREFYYSLRSLDRDPQRYHRLTEVQRAARFIYLNKTGFNGLYRVNRKGEFNVPFGQYSNPDFVSEANLLAVSEYLRVKKDGQLATTFMTGDYRNATLMAKPGDFVYFDPPYDPLSETSSFTSYSSEGFSQQDQADLRDEMLRLKEMGVEAILSNSSTKFIRTLYSDKSNFKVIEVDVHRPIGASSKSRKAVSELVISNFIY